MATQYASFVYVDFRNWVSEGALDFKRFRAGTRISVSLTLNFSVYYTFYKNECTLVGWVLQQPFFCKVLQFLCRLFDIEYYFYSLNLG
jgi:hypothetical protein